MPGFFMAVKKINFALTKDFFPMLFTLRPFTQNDIPSLVKYANNIKIAQFMTNQFPNPYTEEKGRAFIMFANSNSPVHIMAIEINGEAAGGIGLHPQTDIHAKNAELGYWLGEPFWGNGIITRAIPQMIEYGFSNFEINRIFARPFGSNLASQRVLEKNGFVLEARYHQTLYKNGKFEDELVYAVRK